MATHQHINRKTVAYQQSIQDTPIDSLKDHDYFMATLSPTRRYPLNHEPPKPQLKGIITVKKKAEIMAEREDKLQAKRKAMMEEYYSSDKRKAKVARRDKLKAKYNELKALFEAKGN